MKFLYSICALLCMFFPLTGKAEENKHITYNLSLNSPKNDATHKHVQIKIPQGFRCSPLMPPQQGAQYIQKKEALMFTSSKEKSSAAPSRYLILNLFKNSGASLNERLSNVELGIHQFTSNTQTVEAKLSHNQGYSVATLIMRYTNNKLDRNELLFLRWYAGQGYIAGFQYAFAIQPDFSEQDAINTALDFLKNNVTLVNGSS